MTRFVAAGAGRMGRGIAIAFAYAGYRIALLDLRPRDGDAWGRLKTEAQAEIRASLDGLAQLGAIGAFQVEAIAARIELTAADDAPRVLADAELVFEGVSETLDAKREAFALIGRHAPKDAILTSTTSSILVTQIAPFVPQPQRFLNVHWLNPAYLIPVVELSTHDGTDTAVLQRTRALMESIGKLPVVCGPTPGYIVPRLQALVMNEAARLIEEGAATAEEIDKATRYGLGLRFAALGVVEFIDFGGCDILHHASREMAASIDAQRYAAPPIVARMVEQGRLGLKTGSGFYDYADRDAGAYRRDVLARTLALLRQSGLWRPAASSEAQGGMHDQIDSALPMVRRAFADLSVGQVHYAECGDPAAPVVLLLHQTPRSWREYQTVLPLLGKRWRAIALDTPGFGDSAPVLHEPGIEQWARVALELLDRLAVARAHVVGHHTGGVVAVEIAAAQPARVASLVLSSTPFTDAAFRRERQDRPPIDAVPPSTDGTHLAALWRRRQSFYPADRPDLLEAFVADALRVTGDVEAGHRAVAGYRMEDRIARITQPTLLLCADADPFASPHLALWQAALPHAQVAHVEAGMVPLPDQLPDAFADAVLAFIETLR